MRQRAPRQKVDGTPIAQSIALMSLRLFFAAATAAAAALAASPARGDDRVGLYPIALPLGQEQLEGRLAAQLHEGAATLPHVKAFDVLPRGSCAPGDAACLTSALRGANLDQIVSAQVSATPHGYRTWLRLYGADGKLRNDLQEEVQGGPLDLSAALELGICRVLGASPCLGELRVSSEPGAAGKHLFVDGADQGVLPLAKKVSLPVGRHLVQLGKDQARVRVSYGRIAPVLCGMRDGEPALVDALHLFTAAPLIDARTGPEPRSRAARVLFASGAALLAASAGFGLYAHLASSQLDARYRAGALTDADASRYTSVNRTGTIALGLAATGVGAIATGGLVFALAPSGATVLGRF